MRAANAGCVATRRCAGAAHSPVGLAIRSALNMTYVHVNCSAACCRCRGVRVSRSAMYARKIGMKPLPPYCEAMYIVAQCVCWGLFIFTGTRAKSQASARCFVAGAAAAARPCAAPIACGPTPPRCHRRRHGRRFSTTTTTTTTAAAAAAATTTTTTTTTHHHLELLRNQRPCGVHKQSSRRRTACCSDGG